MSFYSELPEITLDDRRREVRASRPSGFTRISNDYEAPEAAEFLTETATRSVTEAVDGIEQLLASLGVLFDDIADLAANI